MNNERQTGGPDAGACRRARASNEHDVAPGRVRRLHRGLPPRRVGVRIRQRSVRSGPGDRGPRELRLPERVSIRIVPGVGPGRPACTGRGRGLVRPARRRGWRPCPGLAGGQPPWPRRDRPIWPGHTPRRPGTRPDMAGRQRQLVFLTRAARRRNGPDASAFPPDPLSRRPNECPCCYLGRATTAVAGRSARVRCRAGKRRPLAGRPAGQARRPRSGHRRAVPPRSCTRPYGPTVSSGGTR